MGVQGSGNFWGFLASISPFESWRKHQVFRHKRDQDRRYREVAESRRLELENEARELANLEKRTKIARQLGATKEQLEPLCNRILGCGLPISPALRPKARLQREPLLLTDGGQDTPSPLPNPDGQDQSGDGLG
jgi:hypothetical protein